MSWLSKGLKSISKGPLGTFWDTHIGRKGIIGEGGEMLGLWQSGTSADLMKREQKRLGGYLEGVEGREQPIRDYYGALGGMMKKDMGNKATAMAFQSRTQDTAIQSGYDTKMGALGFARHSGMETKKQEALGASQFQYGSGMDALGTSFATSQLRQQKAQTGELQGLSDMIYQLRDQYRSMG